MKNNVFVNIPHKVVSKADSQLPSDIPKYSTFHSYSSKASQSAFHKTQSKLIKDLSRVPTFHRRQVLSSMIATFGNNKQVRVPSTIRDNKKCFDVIWDSSASVCVTPHKQDFVDFQTCSFQSVKGIGGKQCKISGKGTVRWSVNDVNGKSRILEVEAFYVPQCNARLLSISQLLRMYQDETVTVSHSHLELSGSNSTAKVIVPISHTTNLPTSATSNSTTAQESAVHELYNAMTVTDEENRNLSAAEKELLRWHQRLGHIDFTKVKHLMRSGALASTAATRQLQSAACKLQHNPKCAACLFAKQTAKPMAGRRTSVVKDRAGILRKDNLLPGQEVSVDHFICSTKGRLFTGYNKGSDSSRYCGGCIFVDHSSGFIHVEFQSSLSSHDTLQAKEKFDKVCMDSGIVIQKFMSDNGTAFTSKQFQDHLAQFQQVSKFAGAGAHHHNAQAERSIRTIMSISRAMMLHAAIHWPDVAAPSLWPMAVSHATYLWNHVPNVDTGLSLSDLFTKSCWPHHRFHHLHVWGSPAYVLDKSIADGMKIPRWKPRSTRCIYLGKSPKHASNVPLVLNPSTGAITGQFHVVIDDWFATVTCNPNDLPDFNSDEWKKLFGDSEFQYMIPEESDMLPSQSAQDVRNHNHSTTTMERIAQSQSRLTPTVKLEDVSEPPLLPSTPVDPSAPSLPVQRTPQVQPSSLSTSSRGVSRPFQASQDQPFQASQDSNQKYTAQNEAPFASSTATPTTVPTAVPTDSPTSPSINPSSSLTNAPMAAPRAIPSPSASSSSTSATSATSSRPSRARKPVTRLTYDGSKSSYTGKLYNVCLEETAAASLEAIIAYFSFAGNVFINKARAIKDPDTLSYDEAMQDVDCLHWIDSAVLEVNELTEHGTWIEVSIESVPEHLTVVPGTWVFRRKRNPDGTFKKFKARYCLCGDLENTNVETYSPVVSYWAVRLFLALTLTLNWYTITIDFSNAFVQAILEEDTYIHIPRGFKSDRPGKTCLKLLKSIYGKANSPRLWHLHILKILLSLGFTQSQYDKCLLLRNDCILILYVDDLGISAKSKSVVDKLLQDIEAQDCKFTRQGSFNDYLGIQYETIANDSIKMTQPGLIKKIIETSGMTRCNPKDSPAIQQALGSDEDGPGMTDPWNYRSIVGMLLYLSGNTRPDIQFAVSQVARFSHNPKQSHANAVKRIIQYLQATKDQGCIFNKPSEIKLNLFVDADFAGLWGSEKPTNSISVKSRTGYLINLSGCYVLSKSCLQTSIAQSTGEAEYIALSQAVRTLLPIRHTLNEILKCVAHPKFSASFKSFVHEDNNSALMLATEQRVSPRTKHYAVKYHWFWSIINNPKLKIFIVKIATELQQADYLTKGLSTPVFKDRRKLTQGW